jgi:hypothetical protein
MSNINSAENHSKEWIIQFSTITELSLIQACIDSLNRIPHCGHDLKLVSIKNWNNLYYTYIVNGGLYSVDTTKLKEILKELVVYDKLLCPQELQDCTNFIWRWNQRNDPITAFADKDRDKDRDKEEYVNERAIPISKITDLNIIYDIIDSFNNVIRSKGQIKLVAIKNWNNDVYAILKFECLHLQDDLTEKLLKNFDKYQTCKELRECTNFIWKLDNEVDPITSLNLYNFKS